jgi:hypothetical protein
MVGYRAVSVASRGQDRQPISREIETTKQFWQQRTDRRFTEEDARQATENVTRFFAVLARWESTAPLQCGPSIFGENA